jgi:glutamate/tyrosine decarboxylase-like PLP-dependent enzyme
VAGLPAVQASVDALESAPPVVTTSTTTATGPTDPVTGMAPGLI